MKIILAYSGGLDTSVAVHWLRSHYNADVVAFCADIGQREDFAAVREKALACGASEAVVLDLKQEYLTDFVYPALRAGALYEGRYTMAAPLGRPLIARYLAELAKTFGADTVAHGSTGKGNDQVRFYAGAIAHNPDLKILAPCAEWELRSREDELRYAHQHGIPVSATLERPYSMDGSLWGCSTECGDLDDATLVAPDDVFQITIRPDLAPDEPTDVTIGFVSGTPVSIDGVAYDPVTLVGRLTQLGGANGIGRLDTVENSLLGIKNRAIYESPAGVILHHAHRELEDMTIDRDTLHLKAHLSLKYAELVYNGMWWSPLRSALDAFVTDTQKNVTGSITMRLYRGSLVTRTRNAAHALLDYALTAHDRADRFDHAAGIGFSYVWSLPIRTFAKTHGPKYLNAV